MKELGELLKKEREKQGLTLEEVSLKIKVHSHKLKAIEENQKEKLPAKVFMIGLIKSYAKELKLDLQEINQLCKELYKDEIPENKVHLNNKYDDKNKFTQFHWFGLFQFQKKIAIGINLFIILLLLIFIFSVIRKTKTQENSYRENMEKSQKESVSNSTNSQKNSDLSGFVKERENENSKIKIQKSLETENLNEKNSSQNSNSKEKPIEKQFDKTNKNINSNNEKKKSFTVNSDNKLIMKALKPIQVEVIWSDGFKQKISLMDNEKKTFVFSKPIRVKISDGGAVLLSFNKDKEKIPGNSNEPVELNYP